MSKGIAAVKAIIAAAGTFGAKYFPSIPGLEKELQWPSLSLTLVCVLTVFLLTRVKPPNPRLLAKQSPRLTMTTLGAVFLCTIYYLALFQWVAEYGPPCGFWLYAGVVARAVVAAAVASMLTYAVSLYQD